MSLGESCRGVCRVSRCGGRCAQAIGARRLRELLNAGPFSLEPNPEGRARDRYGRSLMVVTRGGTNLGEVLLREGLAERYGGPRREWC